MKKKNYHNLIKMFQIIQAYKITNRKKDKKLANRIRKNKLLLRKRNRISNREKKMFKIQSWNRRKLEKYGVSVSQANRRN